MNYEQNKDLSSLNTFGLHAKAKRFVKVNSSDDIQSLISEGVFNKEFFILGGGSNVLFTGDFDGTVVWNNMLGKSLVYEDSESVHLKIGAGENWHDVVMYCVENNWGGVENLSLIPGCVGAAPIQNIGAYGVEIKDTLLSVEYINLDNGAPKTLENKDCDFGYRNSIFKQALKNKVIIVNIVLKLSKDHDLSLEYGAIKDGLSENNVVNPTIKDVSDVVISIRQSKLPDPAELGNSGSFFKNPIVKNYIFNDIKAKHPDARSYPIDDNHVKLAAGWLIESCGWKGKRVGNTGSHAKQALVLVNYGGATGQEIISLAHSIIESVKQAFNVTLEPEVNII
jgi:UDP-N-acetylmuramate dehydrogenase